MSTKTWVSAAGMMVAAALSQAQCLPTWIQPSDGIPGMEFEVYAITSWDPDGAGPLPAGIVAGGQFHLAGHVDTYGLAFWDGNNWTRLGNLGDTLVPVLSLAVLHDNSLVAGFLGDGSTPTSSIARWNGSAWVPLGAGISDFAGVAAMTVLPNGDLVAGGFFATAGGVDVANVARWDGTHWHAMGDGIGLAGLDSVMSLKALPNGQVLAGGYFNSSGATSLGSVALWNGSAWTDLGGGCTDQSAGDPTALVFAVDRLPNGHLVAAGDFSVAGGSPAHYIAEWDGSNWSPLPMELDDVPLAMIVRSNGHIAAGGSFTSAGGGAVPLSRIGEWDGTSWTTYDGGVGEARFSDEPPVVWSLAQLPNGDVIAGGDFHRAGLSHSAGVSNIARWNGASWSELGTGLSTPPSCVVPMPDGGYLIGGYFRHAGTINANKIARFTAGAWQPLGAGLDSGTVRCMARAGNGDIIAGGTFQSSEGVPVNGIARWDGTQWNPMGSGVTGGVFGYGTVDSVFVLPNGDVLAGGDFTVAGGVAAGNIARWDGSQWHAFGGTGLQIGNEFNRVEAIVRLANGDIVIGGGFDVLSGDVSAHGVARWDGSEWHAMGPGFFSPTYVAAMVVRPNGDLIASGDFTYIGDNEQLTSPIVRWDGSQWIDIGRRNLSNFTFNGPVRALAVQPNGDVIAGGYFSWADQLPVASVARWDGSGWFDMSGGVGDYAQVGFVNCVGVLNSGTVVVGGAFTRTGFDTAEPQFAGYLAQWGCPFCPSDFNGDGFVTGDDFDAYVIAFEAGTIDADFDHNGFVNGDDFDGYVLAFEAGC